MTAQKQNHKKLHHNFTGRYERKYLVPDLSVKQIELLLKQHPAIFRQVYHPRFINNLYFDNYQWQNYLDNINGVSERFKIRLRWYSQKVTNLALTNDFKANQVTEPHLEFKLKQGDLVQKYLAKLSKFKSYLSPVLPPSIKNLINETRQKNQVGLDLTANIEISDSWLKKLPIFRPVLFNNYQRKYFLSSDHKIRITIDTKVQFRDLLETDINWDQFRFLPATIVEIKADYRDAEQISQVAKYLPFKLSRCSKYVFGVSSCYPNLETPSPDLTYRTVVHYDH
jgi:hypothetical protein